MCEVFGDQFLFLRLQSDIYLVSPNALFKG